MKKSLSVFLAFVIILALVVGCDNAAAADPDPAPVPDPVPTAVEFTPVAVPVGVEGIVKKESLGNVIITLPDGTDLALNTTGIAGIDIQIGDTVKVEYTEIDGLAVASKIDISAKAEPESFEATGTVVEVSTGMATLTLEDETELVLNIEAIDSLEVRKGDIITTEYIKDGNEAVAVSVEVIEAFKGPEEDKDATTPAPATGVQENNTGITKTAEPSKEPLPADDDYHSDDYFDEEDDYYYDDDYYDDDDEYYDDDEEDTTHSNDSSNNAADVYEAIQLINAERAKAGISALEINSELMAMADIRAEELTVYFEHARPDGRSCWTVFDEFGSSLLPCGENAYWDRCDHTAETAIDAWMNSPGHKANILNSDATKIGIGYCDSYWAMITAY